jgi:hypothetical protein
MFRKLALFISLSLLFGFSASAQDSKADAYIGYQYTRQSFGVGTKFNMNGGVGQIAVYPSKWLGFVGEFSGSEAGNIATHGSGGAMYTVMGGPRLYFRRGPIQPYVQGLFGLARADSTLQAHLGAASSNAFATAIGGGLDVKLRPHFSYRLIQGDYFLTRFDNAINIRFTQNNFRLSTGLVFRF